MNEQVIPPEAVEAAAKYLPHSDDCEVRPERDCTCWQPRVNTMRAALEAAAPYMLAAAWDEGYDRAESDYYGTGFWTKRLRANPYHAAAARPAE